MLSKNSVKINDYVVMQGQLYVVAHIDECWLKAQNVEELTWHWIYILSDVRLATKLEIIYYKLSGEYTCPD